MTSWVLMQLTFFLNSLAPMPVAAEAPPAQTSLFSLPDDVIAMILARLDGASIECVAKCCKRLRNVCIRPQVWESNLRPDNRFMFRVCELCWLAGTLTLLMRRIDAL